MIAIIDHNAGNLTSVARALTYIGAEYCISNHIEKILNADRIIFPGVGAAGSVMKSLIAAGLDNAIKQVFAIGKPILGICVGTQVIMEYSEENNQRCLDIIKGCTRAFSPEIKDKDNTLLKIPQMGWNSVAIKHSHHVLSGIKKEQEFYFVHSFFPEPANKEHIFGTTDYGITFPSIIGSDNLIATQFHPEKSGEAGLNLLKNFCTWKP